MALIKWSGLISEFKGKLNGSIFSNPSYGAQVRNRKSCKGRNSTVWGLRRTALASVASQWKSLTVTQQESFIARVALYPYVNKFGDSVNPSGYQLFCTLSLNLQVVGRPIITTCLDANSEVSFGTFALSVGGGGELEFSYTSPADNNVFALFYMSKPLQSSIYAQPAGMYFIASVLGSASSPFNIDEVLEARFGAVRNGQKYFWRVDIVDRTTGQRYGGQNGSYVVSGHS